VLPNFGTGEMLVVFLVALIVLGPNKLPDVARQAGKMMAELRRLSGGFQDEMRAAMREPTPTLPPLPPEAEVHTPPATVEAVPAPPVVEADPPVDAPKQPTRKRRAPLRADGAVPAEQQLQQD
jgi:sec-independent protein translocase protein TatB